MSRLARPAIVLVTRGATRQEDDEAWRAVVRSVSQAVVADIDVVQIREPQLSDRALAGLVRSAVDQAKGSRTTIVVNDRPDVALAAGAGGVHLRADGVSPARIRTLVPADFVIGRSVHSASEARDVAADGGLDYLFFGTIFQSAGKPEGHPIQGTAALRTVCQTVALPVIAIGGVTLDNAREVSAAGAAGVAAISMFNGADSKDPGELGQLVRELRAAF